MQTGIMLAYCHLDAGTKIDSKVCCIIPSLIHYLLRQVVPGFMVSEMKHVESSATNKRNHLPFAKTLHHT